jgi:hypothetical protein
MYLILGNFGVLDMKMRLRIENCFWFKSYGMDLIRTSYRSADEYSDHLVDCWYPVFRRGLPRRKSGQ